MTTNDWVSVYSTDGKLSAEMVKLRLESFGIEVLLAQESLGGTYGLTVGPLGETFILVPTPRADEAREILSAIDAGMLEASDSNGEDDGSNKDAQSDVTNVTKGA